MGVNKSTGNMYVFVNGTWNVVKGSCPHDCRYCYMKRWGNLKPVRFGGKELRTDLGSGNFIFVGSSFDMWATHIPDEWIERTLAHCRNFPENRYLFQTKNPERLAVLPAESFPAGSVACTTIETNRGIRISWGIPLSRRSGRRRWRGSWALSGT